MNLVLWSLQNENVLGSRIKSKEYVDNSLAQQIVKSWKKKDFKREGNKI